MDRETAHVPSASGEATLNPTLAQVSVEEFDENIWKAPPLSASNPLHQKLGDLDNSLRCPCCGEFFRNPVSLIPCHHTFCSECIRSHFKSCSSRTSRTAFCPSCKEKINTSVSDSKYLIPNRSIQTISENYQSLRAGLRRDLCELASHQTGGSAAAAEPSAVTRDQGGHIISPRRSTRLQNPQKSTDEEEEEEALEQKAEQPCKETRRLEKRPKVVYKFLNRKKLAELCAKDGLSTSGSDKELKARHEEFLNLYNAECDSFSPRSVQELVAEVTRRERARRTEARKSKFTDADSCMSRLNRSRAAAGDEPSTQITSGNPAFDAEMKANFSKLIQEGRKRAGKTASRSKPVDAESAATALNACVGDENRPVIEASSEKAVPSPTAATSDESLSQQSSSASSQTSVPIIPAQAPLAALGATPSVSRPTEMASTIPSTNAMVSSSSQSTLSAAPQPNLTANPPAQVSSSGILTGFFATTPTVSDSSKRSRTSTSGKKKSTDKRQKRSQTCEWQCRYCTLINKTHIRFPPKCAACGKKGSLEDAPNTVVTIDV